MREEQRAMGTEGSMMWVVSRVPPNFALGITKQLRSDVFYDIY